MKNPVAKNLWKFNQKKIEPDKKKRYKRTHSMKEQYLDKEIRYEKNSRFNLID